MFRWGRMSLLIPPGREASADQLVPWRVTSTSRLDRFVFLQNQRRYFFCETADGLVFQDNNCGERIIDNGCAVNGNCIMDMGWAGVLIRADEVSDFNL